MESHGFYCQVCQWIRTRVVSLMESDWKYFVHENADVQTEHTQPNVIKCCGLNLSLPFCLAGERQSGHTERQPADSAASGRRAAAHPDRAGRWSLLPLLEPHSKHGHIKLASFCRLLWVKGLQNHAESFPHKWLKTTKKLCCSLLCRFWFLLKQHIQIWAGTESVGVKSLYGPQYWS